MVNRVFQRHHPCSQSDQLVRHYWNGTYFESVLSSFPDLYTCQCSGMMGTQVMPSNWSHSTHESHPVAVPFGCKSKGIVQTRAPMTQPQDSKRNGVEFVNSFWCWPFSLVVSLFTGNFHMYKNERCTFHIYNRQLLQWQSQLQATMVRVKKIQVLQRIYVQLIALLLGYLRV